MSIPRLFRVRLLSAAAFGARRVVAGSDIELGPHQAAADLIREGRARLLDVTDLEALIDAVALGGQPWPLVTRQS